MSNDPKVLVEFTPSELAWLADRLHEYRQGLNNAMLMKLTGIQERGEASENEKTMIEKLEEHKKTEATLRNRLLNKAAEQGFGDL